MCPKNLVIDYANSIPDVRGHAAYTKAAMQLYSTMNNK